MKVVASITAASGILAVASAAHVAPRASKITPVTIKGNGMSLYDFVGIDCRC